MLIKNGFLFFWKTNEVFSQWHPSPFTVGEFTYQNAEHWMMAMKAKIFSDLPTLRTLYEGTDIDFNNVKYLNDAIFMQILQETNPRNIKAYGRRIQGFNEETWTALREDVVFSGNLYKFSSTEKLKQELLGTDDLILVEAAPNDAIWGIGMDENDPDAVYPEKWKGLNLLGRALMNVRKTLRNV